jgi:8-oxo-dGTP pyrophosphatase MutT (NUDIX family)
MTSTQLRTTGAGEVGRTVGEDLPPWWQPLLSRLATARPDDFTRLPTPAGGGRASAVLVLFGEGAEGPDVLVLERAHTLRTHAGQPAFPGGAADPGDADAPATALREAAEEVGLDPASVSVVTTLPPLWIPVSGFVVTPVLGWWRQPHQVRPVATEEVAAVVRLPVRELVDPANRLRVRHPSGWIGPAFDVRGMLVWGFTAGVIATLLEMGGWAVPWPTDRVEDLPTAGNAPVR